MVIGHHIAEGTLYVEVSRELDVTNRAAAALQIEALVHANRPDQVTVHLPTNTPSPMTFSALARAHRMCQSLGIPLTATGPGGGSSPMPLGESAGAGRPLRLEHGTRHDH
ncbi:MULTISPECIES: hypothetical protein [unclassified Streptomyces]|uniref:hypothetical protein n=1 Tax=unclassified Streptomyces TaxID=2593676 RepID=UPI002E0E33D3|nr:MULTISPECIES: hypothetical protein [unclassified Streptomyces]WSR23205.1 hypothetical protein OG573_31440 [Streptomyces sp. NBC_01205]